MYMYVCAFKHVVSVRVELKSFISTLDAHVLLIIWTSTLIYHLPLSML